MIGHWINLSIGLKTSSLHVFYQGDGDRVSPSSDIQLFITLEDLEELASPPDIPLEVLSLLNPLKIVRNRQGLASDQKF